MFLWPQAQVGLRPFTSYVKAAVSPCFFRYVFICADVPTKNTGEKDSKPNQTIRPYPEKKQLSTKDQCLFLKMNWTDLFLGSEI